MISLIRIWNQDLHIRLPILAGKRLSQPLSELDADFFHFLFSSVLHVLLLSRICAGFLCYVHDCLRRNAPVSRVKINDTVLPHAERMSCPAAHDHMVHAADAYQFACFYNPLGELHILSAGSWIAARMRMKENCGRGTGTDRALHDKRDIRDRLIQVSDTHDIVVNGFHL